MSDDTTAITTTDPIPSPTPAPDPGPPLTLEQYAKAVEDARDVYGAAKARAADSLKQSQADAKAQNASAQVLHAAIATLEAAAALQEPDPES